MPNKSQSCSVLLGGSPKIASQLDNYPQVSLKIYKPKPTISSWLVPTTKLATFHTLPIELTTIPNSSSKKIGHLDVDTVCQGLSSGTGGDYAVGTGNKSWSAQESVVKNHVPNSDIAQLQGFLGYLWLRFQIRLRVARDTGGAPNTRWNKTFLEPRRTRFRTTKIHLHDTVLCLW